MLARSILLLGTLLAGLLAMGGDSPAAAHANHQHRTADYAAPHARGATGTMAQEHRTGGEQGSCRRSADCDLASGPQGLPNPAHEGNCCCGGALCHSSATTTVEPAAFSYREGERIGLPLVLTTVRHVPAGIERPPRAFLTL
jgi:hypothetical protein